MKINTMFQKDINRPIQGVVKVGQDTADMITNELDEYVVTKELHRHFYKFFESYRRGTQTRTDKMGVWISGFFGSGKSHFLKILSYLLGDEEYDGKKPIIFFDGKIEDNQIMADMEVAANTNADVILFNIDAETDSDAKSNKDPIVKVFMKMFNKMQGFCASMPWIADLERQMVKEGNYGTFKAKFKEISGYEWETARNDFDFEQDNIVKALSESTRMSADAALAWYNRAEKNYALDISSFARRVAEYIEMKESKSGKKQFVVFLCDEVGQYIGSDTKLMLNLQTIVEGLGNECGGRAWVICTGQEDIDSITKVKRDDFSKIIGRFDTRLNLSSANVDEVIKKRLLAKKENAADKLRLLYADKSAVLKNLITFSQDTPEKRLYDSAEDFVDVYPFIPYQFNLLQAVFNSIRTHGASGKHLSEGERSLLNAFQEAAREFRDFDEGILIPFDAFYRTVETFLDHNIKQVILNAEDSAGRDSGALLDRDVEVLKVLFMVKYIPRDLPANLENITTIMLQSIDEDKIAAKKTIDASLRRLEEQKLISKNGDQFIFLTNEEQDINREIREIRIDQSEIIDKVGGEIFNILFGLNKKFRYADTDHDFGFNTIIDDRPQGAQREEINIRVLTPYFDHGRAEDFDYKGISARENRSVIVALPSSDTAFLDEMEQALQIAAFMRRNTGRALTEEAEVIRVLKGQESKQRTDRCKELIVEALKKAAIYVNGNRLDIKEKPPTQRINEAFNTLIEIIYFKLNYINKSFTADSLREVLLVKDTQMILEGADYKPGNHLAVAEMLDAIERSHYRNMSTTIRTFSDLFKKIPYGWKELDIAGVLLTLFKNEKIRLELNGDNIPTTDLSVINYVTKNEYKDRLLIKWRDKVSPELIANAKKIASEVFNRSNVPNDEDGLMERIKELAKRELSNNSDESPGIYKLLNRYENTRYPGGKVLENGKKLFEQIERIKDIKGFYEYLHTEREALLDYEEDVQDIKKFFKNQRGIFDKALKMLDIYDGNRSYVLDPETIAVVADIEKITKLQSPYSQIKDLPDLVDLFMTRFGHLLEEECKPIRMNIESDRDITIAELNRREFKDKFLSNVRSDFDALLERLSKSSNMYVATSMKTESEQMKKRFIQMFLDEEARIATEQAQTNSNDKPTPPIRHTKIVDFKTLFVGTKHISNKQDIDILLDDLRTKLEAQLGEDTTIQII